MRNPITIVKDGREFGFWTSATVIQSMDAAAGSFSLEVSQPSAGLDQRNVQPWAIPAQSRVQILADGELILTGYVDSHSASIDATSHSVTISGRSLAGQLVDSAILNSNGWLWKNRDPLSIMREVAQPFGIDINTDALLDRVRTFKMASTGRAFDAIRTLAFRSGVAVVSQPDGSISLTQTSKRRTGFSITHPLTASMTASFSDRPSKTIVHGQAHGYDGDALSAAQVASEIIDGAVTLYRPRIVQAAGDTSGADAATIAAWHRARALGDSLSLSITVSGLRDPNGALWSVNTLTHVHLPVFGLSTELLIASVDFTLNGTDGAVTAMTLKHPGSYSTKPTSDARKQIAAASDDGNENPINGAMNAYVQKFDLNGDGK